MAIAAKERLPQTAGRQTRRSGDLSFIRFVMKNRALYILLIPGIVYFILMRYVPLLGSMIAFQDYNIFEGFLKSDWVGFYWFHHIFTNPQFGILLRNTIIISFAQILFAFPAPIILALLMNEIRNMAFKRVVQTMVYLPHFLSWALVYGLVYMMFSVQSGLVNDMITRLGGEPLDFLQKADYFRTLVIGTGMWKEMGWSTIIFLAALSGINPSLYEAAKIDGANRWKQLKHITLPGILPAVTTLLLLKVGHVMDVGFEQIYVFLNPMVLEVGDVLDTYSYRAGIINGQFSLTTAMGLFKSIVGLVLLVISNRVSRATTGESLY